MTSRDFTVKNPEGFHMRPAAAFSEAMAKYSCDVTVIHGERFNGKSIVSLLSACIEKGSVITVECNGADENEAIKEAGKLIEGGLL